MPLLGIDSPSAEKRIDDRAQEWEAPRRYVVLPLGSGNLVGNAGNPGRGLPELFSLKGHGISAEAREQDVDIRHDDSPGAGELKASASKCLSEYFNCISGLISACGHYPHRHFEGAGIFDQLLGEPPDEIKHYGSRPPGIDGKYKSYRAVGIGVEALGIGIGHRDKACRLPRRRRELFCYVAGIAGAGKIIYHRYSGLMVECMLGFLRL